MSATYQTIMAAIPRAAYFHAERVDKNNSRQAKLAASAKLKTNLSNFVKFYNSYAAMKRKKARVRRYGGATNYGNWNNITYRDAYSMMLSEYRDRYQRAAADEPDF